MAPRRISTGVGTLAVVVVAALATLAQTGCGVGPVAPSIDLGGTLSGGPYPPSAIQVDAPGLAYLNLALKVGETTQLRITVGRPNSPGNRAYDKFLYLFWSWNDGRYPEFTPTSGPLEIGVESCDCTPFGEPVWEKGHWAQRAWLAGSQTVALRLRGVSAGQTQMVFTGCADPPRQLPDGMLFDTGWAESAVITVTVRD